jgi:chromosome partitioning protein
MPVIAVANSKGGSGKSTTALILAGELADRGGTVILIDADPRRPAAAWAELPGKPTKLSVVSSAGERGILDEIEQSAATVPFVIVDLEGTASRLTSYAIGQADLVLVPAQEEHQDAQAALDTVAEVLRDAQAVRRQIPTAIVLTRTSSIKSRTARYVSDQLRASGAAPVLRT